MVWVPMYPTRVDTAFAAVCVSEVTVVLQAASGWLAGGR